MTTGDEDLILQQRRLAAVRLVSQELKADEVRKAQKIESDTNVIKEELDYCAQGYDIAIKQLEEHPELFKDPALIGDERDLSRDDCLLKACDLELLKDKEAMGDILMAKREHEWDISSNVLMLFYVVAQRLFDQKRFTEAQNIYIFLTLINRAIHSFWIGRAACAESQEQWDRAIDTYLKAQALGLSEPYSYEGLIRIYTRMGYKDLLDGCYRQIDNFPELREKIVLRASGGIVL